ncbi:MAG: TolC family protein [Saprospiraceae bacterium]|nr:TolC family protein [Saprospiraceae bacterium]
MKRLGLLWLFSALVYYGNAQERLELTLEQAQEIALANNFTLKDNQLDTEIAEATVKETISIGLPKIDGRLNYTDNPVLQESPIPAIFFDPNAAEGDLIFLPFGAKKTSAANISLDQLLFDGTYLLGIKAARDFVKLREKREKITERDIRFDVAQAYMGALIAQENIDIIEKNISNVSQLKSEVEATYDAGFVEQLDVDRLVLSLANLEVQKNSLERIKQLNYNVLKNTLSVPTSTEIVLTEAIATMENDLMDQAILLEDPSEWPEYEVLRIQEELETKNIKQYKLGYLPKVRLFADAGYFNGRDSFSDLYFEGNRWFGAFNYGVNVNIPIFDGNMKKAQIRNATAVRDKVSNQLLQLDQQVDIAVANARINYQNALAQVKSQRDNIQLAEKIYSVTQIKYREGVGSSLELNQAEQELYTTQQNYINALYELLLAKVDLEKALGK